MVHNLQSRIYKVRVKSSHSWHEWRQLPGKSLRGLLTSTYFILFCQYAQIDVVAMLQHVWCGTVMMHQKCCVPPAFLHQLLERDQFTGRNFQEKAISASTAPLGLRPVGCHQRIIRLTLKNKKIFLLWALSLTGCNEITAIWDGWNSFGRWLGGGSLEGMDVPWQGDELHDLIGVFHLQYLWLLDY